MPLILTTRWGFFRKDQLSTAQKAEYYLYTTQHNSMKVLSLLLLFTAAAVGHASEISQNLRGGDVDDVNFLSSESRELTTDCVARSTYMGCYADRNQNRAMPVEVPGKGHTARECESKCIEMGYSFFARQWKGQVSI